MSKGILFSLILVMLLSCSSSERDFIRTNELFIFLTENGLLLPEKDLIALIIYKNDCNTCVKSISRVIECLVGINNVAIIFESQSVYEKYSGIKKGSIFEIISDPEELQSKGLYFPESLIFFIEDSEKLEYWKELGYSDTDTIIKKIGKFSP